MPFFSFKDVLFSAAFLVVVLLAARVASFVVVSVVGVAAFTAVFLLAASVTSFVFVDVLTARIAPVSVYVLTAETVRSFKGVA